MTGDGRVQRAREYLAGARRRKVGTLPPSALVRELAEARRLLGQLLDAYGELEAALAPPPGDQELGALAAEWPGWEIWRNRGGQLLAWWVGTSPQVLVEAATVAGLRLAIEARLAEGSNDAG